MAKKSKEFNILIVSPIDVKYERDIITNVCKELNKYLINYNIALKANKYEDFPQDFNENAQDSFENYFKIEEANLVVAIFWKRLGTVLPNKALTGSQHEIKQAIKHKKSLWIYIKKNRRYDEDVDDDIMEDKEQYERLKLYLDQLNVGLGNTLSHHYFYKKEFEEKFKLHLIKYLNKIYNINLDEDELIDAKIYKKSIPPIYMVMLSIFFILATVLLWQYNIEQKNQIEYFINFFTLSSVLVNSIAIYTINFNIDFIDTKFKNITIVLIKRGLLILTFSLILAFSFWQSFKSLGWIG